MLKGIADQLKKADQKDEPEATHIYEEPTDQKEISETYREAYEIGYQKGFEEAMKAAKEEMTIKEGDEVTWEMAVKPGSGRVKSFIVSGINKLNENYMTVHCISKSGDVAIISGRDVKKLRKTGKRYSIAFVPMVPEELDKKINKGE